MSTRTRRVLVSLYMGLPVGMPVMTMSMRTTPMRTAWRV